MKIGLGIGLGYSKESGGGAVAPVNTIAPVISGTTTLGSTLTSTTGTWTGIPEPTFTFQWYRGATLISGATNSTYVTVLADSTASITCRVTGTNTAGSSVAISNALTMGNYAPVNSVAPVISGTEVVGQVLTTTNGTWSNSPSSFSYQWKRGATNVGTNATTYTLVTADAGQIITCVVTATNAAGSANATSNALSILSTLLDIYPNAAAAYSVRLLRGAYYGSPAIRVRRSNDNAEQNIGFTTSGNLDTSELTTFVGANSGFIVRWFDQSGNGLNQTQTTAANQPQIVSSGAVLLQGTKPTLRFDGTNDFMDGSGVTTGDPKSIFIPTKAISLPSSETVIFDSVTTNQALLYKSSSNLIAIAFGSFNSSSYTATTNFILYSILQNSTNSNAYINSSTQIYTNANLGTNAFNGLRIASVRGTAALFYNGNIPEFVVYGSNQASNRTGIESNINTYYGIY